LQYAMLSTLKRNVIIVDSPYLHTCRQMTYTRKVERVSPNVTHGGYVLGVKDVDIFKPPVVEGPRITLLTLT